MNLRYRLWFGSAAAGAFLLGTAALALMVPGYSQVHQTISEIGEMGSPARVPFAITLVCVAACILVFASAVRRVCSDAGRSSWAAYLIGYMAVPMVGLAIFASPHPLHNVFGISEIIAYVTLLVLALAWRREPRAKALVTLSWIASLLVWVALALNLSALQPNGAVWTSVAPVIGIAQRTLFITWFGWCAITGIMLSDFVAAPG